MGQYHKIYNLDKREMIHPHDCNDGLKLWEHDRSLRLLSYLLACSTGRGGGDYDRGPSAGAWAGDRIAVIGDYAEEGDIPGMDASAVYNDKSFRNITKMVHAELEQD